MQSQKVDRVLVVGGGSAGFMSALALKKKLPQATVSLVRSKQIPIIGVGESTTVAFPKFIHEYLDIPYSSFFDAVKPSWKLGIRFEWGDPAREHFNYSFDSAMGAKRPILSKNDAYYCLNDDVNATISSSLMDQKLAPCFGRNGQYRMRQNFGYHLDAHLLVEFLEALCSERGIEVLDGDVDDVRVGEDGIESIKLANGSELTADLYIDCTGFRSLLLSKSLGIPFRSFGDNLFCDRALAGRFKRDGVINPYTTTATMNSGWRWRIEFEDHVTSGYVFSSEFCDEAEAERELLAACPELAAAETADLRLLKFPRGRYEAFWVKNVAAIGNSSGFVEPLEATALHMIAEQLRGLCQSLADCNGQSVPAMRDLQNRRCGNLWDDICSFLAIHYKFNHHRDTPFWRHCHNETDLTLATDFVEAYRQAGPSVWLSKLLGDSIFGFDGYMCMLIGQKVPTEFSPDTLATEMPAWHTHRRGIENNAKRAMPVRESLRLVKSPHWPWPTA